MRWRCVGLVVLAGLIAPACSRSADVSGEPPATTAESAPAPALELVPCTGESFSPTVRPADKDVDCALLTVLEDRKHPSGRSLHLPVVVLRSQSPERAPDPIIYLSGGPGDRATDTASQFIASGRGGQHDLVLLDQRGTGRTRPNLNCPEAEAVIWANFETTDELMDEGARTAAAYAACRTRLGRSGSLDAYRSTESAHDVSDLRQALGVDKVNLLGESYGTAVALEVLRLHPNIVRSVVLDSVVAPWADDGAVATAERIDDAIARFIDGCESDPGCGAAHPDLKQALLDVRERFDESPHRVTFQDSLGHPRTANLTGGDVLRGIVQALYDPALIPLLPGFIEQLRGGSTSVLDAVGAGLLGTAADPPEGLVASVNCAERGSKTEPGALEAAARDHPLSGSLLTPSVCGAWDVPPVDRSFRLVGRANIPTLVLAGHFDPVTPPTNAREVSSKLGPRSTFVEFPGLGHGVLHGGACADGLITRFLATPTDTVDQSCVRALPAPVWAG